jgi:protein-L-isoaspartate(D-aspartate) O-methyltransferase
MLSLEDCRRFYSEEVRLAANIQSTTVIEAFARVPREDFLGPGPWQAVSPDLGGMSALSNAEASYTPLRDPRDLYHNILVVLDKAAGVNNGQPSSLARWIEALDLQPGACVYHLGCGAGYYTAILAELVGPGGSVLGTEIHPELAVRAHQNLSRYPNVTVSDADGAMLDPSPCDAMFIHAWRHKSSSTLAGSSPRRRPPRSSSHHDHAVQGRRGNHDKNHPSCHRLLRPDRFARGHLYLSECPRCQT